MCHVQNIPLYKFRLFRYNNTVSAGMMELADMRDLGSRAIGVGVQIPIPAPTCIGKKDAGKNLALRCGIFALKTEKAA